MKRLWLGVGVLTALLAVGGNENYKMVFGASRTDKKLAYTMDCGSRATYLPQILDILDEYGLKITFFVTGKFAEKNPKLVQDMARRGHEIGNHSWSHPNFNELEPEKMIEELEKTSDLIESLTGTRPVYFRPPEGACKRRTVSIVRAAGYEVIRWTHDCCDARKEASEKNSLKHHSGAYRCQVHGEHASGDLQLVPRQRLSGGEGQRGASSGRCGH